MITDVCNKLLGIKYKQVAAIIKPDNYLIIHPIYQLIRITSLIISCNFNRHNFNYFVLFVLNFFLLLTSQHSRSQRHGRAIQMAIEILMDLHSKNHLNTVFKYIYE